MELEEGIAFCPLCGVPVNGQAGSEHTHFHLTGEGPQFTGGHVKMSRPQRKFTWEIASIILLSGAIASIAINLIISKKITWSEYPLAISLTIFSYVSIFTFWNQKTIPRMAAGFIVSCFFLVMLDTLTRNISWEVKLGIPLLLASNLVMALLIAVIRVAKYKGINLIAYSFLGSAILCICIEGILSFYRNGSFHLDWSIIVAACTVPVSIVLFFVHFRLKRGQNLERTFHI
ncbi:hypothetical protein MMC2321_00980 [Chitinophaga sp. MM2321]